MPPQRILTEFKNAGNSASVYIVKTKIPPINALPKIMRLYLLFFVLQKDTKVASRSKNKSTSGYRTVSKKSTLNYITKKAGSK